MKRKDLLQLFICDCMAMIVPDLNKKLQMNKEISKKYQENYSELSEAVKEHFWESDCDWMFGFNIPTSDTRFDIINMVTGIYRLTQIHIMGALTTSKDQRDKCVYMCSDVITAKGASKLELVENDGKPISSRNIDSLYEPAYNGFTTMLDAAMKKYMGTYKIQGVGSLVAKMSKQECVESLATSYRFILSRLGQILYCNRDGIESEKYEKLLKEAAIETILSCVVLSSFLAPSMENDREYSLSEILDVPKALGYICTYNIEPACEALMLTSIADRDCGPVFACYTEEYTQYGMPVMYDYNDRSIHSLINWIVSIMTLLDVINLGHDKAFNEFVVLGTNTKNSMVKKRIQQYRKDITQVKTPEEFEKLYLPEFLRTPEKAETFMNKPMDNMSAMDFFGVEIKEESAPAAPQVNKRYEYRAIHLDGITFNIQPAVANNNNSNSGLALDVSDMGAMGENVQSSLDGVESLTLEDATIPV